MGAPPIVRALQGMMKRVPFYQLSALSMLLGCYTLNNALALRPGQAGKLLLLLFVLNVYEALLMGLGLFLVQKRGLREDGRTLLLLEVLLRDVTLLTGECFASKRGRERWVAPSAVVAWERSITAKTRGGLSMVGIILLLAAPTTKAASAVGEEVAKDGKGRVVARRTTNPDQSSHRSTFRYRPDSEQPIVVVEEDFDPSNRATRKVVTHFDAQGRIEEKLELTIDTAGKETGKRTRYQRHADGRISEQITPVK